MSQAGRWWKEWRMMLVLWTGEPPGTMNSIYILWYSREICSRYGKLGPSLCDCLRFRPIGLISPVDRANRCCQPAIDEQSHFWNSVGQSLDVGMEYLPSEIVSSTYASNDYSVVIPLRSYAKVYFLLCPQDWLIGFNSIKERYLCFGPLLEPTSWRALIDSLVW